MFLPSGRQLLGRIAAICALGALGALLATGAAVAEPVHLTISPAEPTLEERGDGSATVALTLGNQTYEAVTLDAGIKGATGCRLGLDRTTLAKGGPSSPVTILVPADCISSEPLQLTATASGSASSQVFEVPLKKETEEKAPDWEQLYAFAIALAGSLLLLMVLFFKWEPKEESRRRPGQRLSALEATWKLNENWATNVTSAGALLTGLFGASVAKAFLGEEAESLLALATVGGGLALVFVATATIVLLAFKSYKVPDEKDKRGKEKKRAPEAFTVGGVILAAAFILASAIGQLWVATYTVRGLGLDTAEDVISWAVFVLGTLLLLIYSWRSLRDTLERGTDDLPAKETAVEIQAADLIVKAIENSRKSGHEQGTARRALHSELKTAQAIPRRPRSALI